jgi:carbamoyl-phosphate synthase small subunit
VALAHDPDGKFDLEALVAAARGFKGLEGVDLAKGVTCTQSYRWDEMRWAWPEGYPVRARGPRAQGRGARLRRETQHPALPRSARAAT